MKGQIISALRNWLNNVWQQLKSNSNDLESIFIPIDVELFLLICSIFPDDSVIPIEDLVLYGRGLSLFGDVHNLTEAKCRVYDLIKIINDLKYPPKVSRIRFVHEEDRTHRLYVKILVGARDLAKSISSSCPLVFHRQTIMEKWPESNCYENCYGLSLELKKVKEQHVKLECPKLTLLQLRCREDSQRIPTDFFEGMKELCVLSLDVPSLPQSLSVLSNLTTLRLKALKVGDMSWIGGLINLEFLSISVLSMTDIPRETGQLENLRLLDIRDMNIQHIPSGILSRLLKLEELYLPLSFKRWGCKVKKYDDIDEWELGDEDNYDDQGRIITNISEIDDVEKINANLSDITSLSLNSLQISMPNASVLPKKSLIFENIQEFKILMPNNVRYQPFEKDSLNELQLTGEACDIHESGICDLMSRTEELSLTRVTNLTNVINQLENNGFPQLKKMIIVECDELEYVVDATKTLSLSEGDCLFKKLECHHLSMLSNLREICHGRWTDFQWLPCLSQISIRFCHKLKYVFPLSVVKGSILKSIEVLCCNEMEGIFLEDEEEDVPCRLCSIEQVELHSLPKLISLLVNRVQDCPNQSLTAYKIVFKASGLNGSCAGNRKLFVYQHTQQVARNCKEVSFEQHDSILMHWTQSIKKKLINVSLTKTVDIISHTETECAFPSKLAEKWLQNLKRLKIAFCDAVKVIFLFEENHATSTAFNLLAELELHGLSNLVHIWFHIPPKITTFQNLRLLVLVECNVSYLFPRQVAKLLVQLEKVCVSRCKKMEEIMLKVDEREVKSKIVFPRLQVLELQRIPNLRAFSSGIYEIELPLLESLKFNQCNKMKIFSKGVSRTPMLERIEINGSLCSLTGDLNATMRRLHCQFLFANLKIATKGWSPDRELGKGYFGKVYIGWIDEKTFAPSTRGTGMLVAIMKLNSKILHGFEEWQSEVEFLQKLSHPNLVKLLGYCSEDKGLLLVYEFMKRGSLDNHLFTSNTASEPLSWDMRIKIAIGAARGLDFLHNMSVINGDINPSSILLDDNYNAKISDYGFARSRWLSDNYSLKIIGNPGYVASGIFSEMAHKNADRLRLNELLDVRIRGQCSPKAVLLAVKLAFNCVEHHAKNLPSMKEVVAALEQIDAIKKKPEGANPSQHRQL